jgi:ABC-type lipoprotein release transport system permease subunit
MLALAWKDLLHHRGQTLFNVLGLAVVVFNYLILTALAQTMDGLVQENRLNRNLVVVQADMINLGDASLGPEVLQAAQELSPGWISLFSPVIFRQLRLDGQLMQLRAARLEDWEPLFRLELIAGSWPDSDSELAIGEGAARVSGWQVGSQVRLYGRAFTASGIFRSPGTVFASVCLPLETAQQLFAPRRAAQLLYVQAAAGVDAEDLRQRLQSHPALAGRYSVYFEENYTRRNTQAVKDIASLMRVVSASAMLAVSLGIYNATSLSLVERSHEVGILRAVGFAPAAVLRFLLARALLLGCLAYAGGLAAAALFAAHQGATEPLFVYSWPLIYQVDWVNAALALGWMSALAPVGAWLAGRQWLRQGVCESLRRPA